MGEARRPVSRAGLREGRALGQDGRPWFVEDGRTPGADPRLHAPATLRNRDAIADVLARELPPAGLALEMASGSGEHVIHFARLFPALDWQPSDPDPLARASIAAWVAEAGLPNIRAPLDIDATRLPWPLDHADALLCINMTHISPWDATQGLFAGAARIMAAQAPLILYGPFLEGGVETAPGNRSFDAQLRARDPRYGLRAVEDIDSLAALHGFGRHALHRMPANNLTLVYRLSSTPRPS